MFYYSLLLNRKGPLSRIWLAAHLDKKLTKGDVNQTDIDASVSDILGPSKKMTLRLSGHLMVGVVRIHARKTKYLLEDCADAVDRLKKSFRPIDVDQNDVIVSITLQEDEDDAESILSRAEHYLTSVNQCLPRDITMNEEFEEPNLGFDSYDNFGDEIILYNRRERSETNLTVGENNIPLNQRNLSLVYNGDGDDFDGISCHPHLADYISKDLPTEVFSTFGGNTTKYVNLTGDGNIMFQSYNTDINLTSFSGIDSECFLNNDKTTNLPCLIEEDVPGVINDSLISVILPVVTTKPTSRKRKLNNPIDLMKQIPSDVMQSRMQDTSDITSPMNLAPPTRELMKIRILGSASYIFSNPGNPNIPKKLRYLFQRNHKTLVIPNDPVIKDVTPRTLTTVHEDVENINDISHKASEVTISDIEIQRRDTLRSSEMLDYSEYNADFSCNDRSIRESDETISNIDPRICDEVKENDIISKTNNNNVNRNLQKRRFSEIGNISSLVNDSTDIKKKKMTEIDLDQSIEEWRHRRYTGSLSTSGIVDHSFDFRPIVESNYSGRDASKESQYVDSINNLERKSQILLDSLKKEHIKNIVIFSQFANLKSKKEVASNFYSLLLLGQSKVISLRQESPESDIIITLNNKT